MVRSKYSLSSSFSLIFIAIICFFAPLLFLKSPEDKLKFKYMVCLLPAVSFLLLYFWFQKIPRIILDESFITIKTWFRTRTYRWIEINKIFVSRKESHWAYLRDKIEASVIVFGNQEKLVFYSDMYRNSDLILRFIHKMASADEADPKPNITPTSLNTIQRRIYAGNAYTCFNSLMIVGIFALFFIKMNDKVWWNTNLFLPFVFTAFLYIFLGMQMNYFLIDAGQLVIRNHYFPWKLIRIDLNDIERIDIETPYRRSNGLRVLLKSYKTSFFGAGSLRNRNWKVLMDDFNTIGIPIRDDR